MTEKMTQTFTMAFTAKCAECSVCERSKACNLSGLFYILYKESASPCFFTLLQSECLLEEVRAGGDEHGSSDVRRPPLLDLLLEGGNISLDHISFVACGYSHVLCVYLFVVYQCGASVDSGNMGHCSGEVSIGRQLTNKAGVHANSGQSGP